MQKPSRKGKGGGQERSGKLCSLLRGGEGTWGEGEGLRGKAALVCGGIGMGGARGKGVAGGGRVKG